MHGFRDYYDELKRQENEKEKQDKVYEEERDTNFVKLLQDQQILHLAECDDRYALHLIKKYKKEERNLPLIDDIEAAWEDLKLDKDLRYYLVIVRIFSPERYQTIRQGILQGRLPKLTVGLNEKSRYIIDSLIISVLELPYRIWPYWKNINEMTFSVHFHYRNQKFAEGYDEHFFRMSYSKMQQPVQHHILKSAEELGAKPIPKKKKYWVKLKHEISYPDDKGQIEPAKNLPYVITLPDGKKEEGKLDGKGEARHDNLENPGQCSVEYCPDIDKKIKEKQAEIKKALAEIVKAEQQETIEIEEKLSKAEVLGSNTLGRADAYRKAARKGVWKAAKGLGEFAYEASLRINPLTAPFKAREDITKLRATYKSLKNVSDEDLLTYALLMSDDDTHALLMSFAKDYTAAQHSLEITEAGGMVAFEIVIILVTMGAGAIASVRHIGKLKKLKSLIEDLVKLLKQKAFKKKKSGDTNTTLESKNEQKVEESNKTVARKRTNYRAPLNKRHSIKYIKQGGVKKNKNTVAEPWVDMKAEVSAINRGKGIRDGNIFTLGERKYELINGDHLVPNSGIGFHNLGRGEYDALGLLNKLGETTKTQNIAFNGIGLSQESYQRVVDIWRKGQ